MEFGEVPLAEGLGAILAHSQDLGGRRLRKGTRLEAADLEALAAAGVTRVVVARPAPEDMGEDAAAAALARALVPQPEAAGLTLATPFTGRVNLLAARAGLVVIDAAAVNAFNRVDPSITIATLPAFARVVPKALVATIKVIPYAVPGPAVERAAACAAAAARGAVRIAGWTRRRAGLILTEVAGPAAKLNAKASAVTRARLAKLDMELAETRVVPHRLSAIAAALTEVEGDIVLILTGSATSDPRDIGPEALRRAGGHVERFGMPVDPGNLLFLGVLGERPVIGLPGCARAPALNGADWVLERTACGLEVSGEDIAGMGIGGLLKEIPERPQPRQPGAARR